MKLYFYENGIKKGYSTKAFEVIETKELMREWTLTFSMDNLNPMRKYIKPGAIFEIDEQLFDIYSFHQNTGLANITEVVANHVSYRLNRYSVAPEFSYLGTAAEILGHLLETAVDGDGNPASEEFSVGECADIGTIAFSLGNERDISLRSACLGLQDIGVEVDYDNFAINLPERIGSETGRTFRFGVDLVDINRDWSVDNGTTYTIAIAAIGRLPGAADADKFRLGDTVTIIDDVIGDGFTRRLVKYPKCHDNPAKDTITLGVFIRDSATNAIQMKTQINNSVQQGASYDKVRITNTGGVQVYTPNDLIRLIMSASEGGFKAEKFIDGQWKMTGGISPDGYMTASRLTTPDSPGFYAVAGKGPESGDGYGLFLVKNADDVPVVFSKIWPAADGNTVMSYRGNMVFINEDNGRSFNFKSKNNGLLEINGLETFSGSFSVSTSWGSWWLQFESGLLVGVT